jgi:hypothetical protein
LQWLLLYVGGLMLVFELFFCMEYTWDVNLHTAQPYEVMAVGTPLLFAVLWQASRNHWACTVTALIYTVFVEALVLILPLFPAEPKLGPVFQTVTHLVPPKFPILLIVPAILLDVLWSATQKWKPWQIALVSGPAFVLPLVAAEWPLAGFLMTKAAANRFFGTMYVGYGESPRSFDVLRQFADPEHGAVLMSGLAWAALIAFVSTWVGIKLGRWMRGIQR